MGGKLRVLHGQQPPPDNLEAEQAGERGGSREEGLVVGWEKEQAASSHPQCRFWDTGLSRPQSQHNKQRLWGRVIRSSAFLY